MGSNPALQVGGGLQPQAPQAQTPQGGIIGNLVRAITGQPQAAPAPATAPQRPISPAAPPPAAMPAQAAPVTPTPPTAQPAPSQAAPAQASPSGQPSAQAQALIPPSADPDQVRARIAERYDRQIGYLSKSPNPADREQANKLYAERQAKLAAIDQPDTETKTVQLPNGETAYATGNIYHGYRDSGQPHLVPAQIEANKAYSVEQAKNYVKKQEHIETNANNAQAELPQLQLLSHVLKDPNFYSGWQAGNVQAMSSAARAIGLSDGQTASLMQFASKLGSAGSLENIQEMAQYGAVRVPEMHMIEKSNMDINNTPQANAAVVEIRQRLAQRQVEIADMANAYADQHGGQINRGFDQEVRNHFREKPLFTDQEVDNYNGLLSGKSQMQQQPPQASGPARIAGDEDFAKLPSGAQFIGPDGKLRRKP